jgi:uncharacterized protein YjbI with pentapeptide repeats
LFVTVGGAIGGYLVGQLHATKSRIDFERRKMVDAVYQSILQELAGESALLRGAAAVKLGSLLVAFPSEWECTAQRQKELVGLTKSVLASSLATEKDAKVLKTLAANLLMHRHLDRSALTRDPKLFADVRQMDLSLVHAEEAYWARADFSECDFFGADLSGASFRNSVLSRAQFREAKLRNAVLAGAVCTETSFKLADLRGADFTASTLDGVDFEGAHVYGARLGRANLKGEIRGRVDLSEEGSSTRFVTADEWLKTAENCI